MKLRYYLRGLGTGILVTALILGRLISESRPLTDAEIKAKALTLGMVDANSLSLSNVGGSEGNPRDSLDIGPETGSPEPEKTPEQDHTDMSASPSPDGSFEPEEGSDIGTDTDDADGQEITDSPEPVTTPDQSSTPEVTPEMTTPTPDSAESVTIEIYRGDSSYAVCVRLEAAGLVENASEFDTYLVDNGYSRTIRAGTYRIPVGASWEEIADMIA